VADFDAQWVNRINTVTAAHVSPHRDSGITVSFEPGLDPTLCRRLVRHNDIAVN
jgi:hypothetical protein